MATSIQPPTAVAADATHWDVEGYRIWESAEPGVLLYARHELRLATDTEGHPIAAVTRTLKWNGTTYKPSCGAAVLGFLGADPDDAATLLPLQDAWTRVIRAAGYAGAGPGADPRYVPLPLRDATLSAQLDPAQATVAAGQTGTTLQVDLTAAGVAAWTAAIGADSDAASPATGTVRLTYAYLQLMPPSTAVVQVHGVLVYTGLAALLTSGPDGEVSGTQQELRTAWTELVRTGAIEVSVIGPPSDSLAATRDALVDQALQTLFDTMFVDCLAATAGPPRYALRWKRATDVPDLPVTVSVEGPTWLTDTLEASVAHILSRVDPAAVHDVHPADCVPVLVVVGACDQVNSTTVALDFGAAHVPEVLVFDGAGGDRTITVTTDRIDELMIHQRTRVTFRERSWPPVTDEGTVEDFVAVVDPITWLRKFLVCAFVIKDGAVVGTPASTDDVLAVNVRYEDPALSAAITTSAQLDPYNGSMDVTYPVPPSSRLGTLTVDAVGSVGGRTVRGSHQADPNSIFVLLLIEDGSLRFVSSEQQLDTDPLSERARLLTGRPSVRRDVPPRPETGRDLAVSYDVPLVPQSTTVSGWAAAAAMIVAVRDRIATSPAELAAQAAMDLDIAYAWPRIRAALPAWGLVEEVKRGTTAQQWAAWLGRWGPLWVVEAEAPYHAAIVGRITGDGTPQGTWVRLHNPWPPEVGGIEHKTFADFDQEFDLGDGSGAVMVHG
ncbi:papain-like cysteine protease family protein [Streptomyces sp. NPDC056704]|uniref:papain-like cysteine protease family protein n=1 Tax=Streptomyces sp. NPDC056704 TaxID=3345917 RepID=UPI0036C441A1